MSVEMPSAKYVFNSAGMSVEELLFHSKLEKKYPKHTIEETERYGIGTHLRKYGFYPQAFPLLLHCMHGPSQWDYVQPHFLKSKDSCFGFYSKRLVLDWKSKSNKKVYLLKSPNTFYKNNKNIKKAGSAKGAIFFHSHSSFWTDRHTDYEVVFKELNNLPEQFHPIAVCVHFVDVQKGSHIPYLEKGYSVYTAGNWHHPYFIENFYEIVRNYSYGVSNSLGSNVLYCVDFGMPFSVIKGYPEIIKNTDNNIQTVRPSIEHKQYQKNLNLFTRLNLLITPEQQELVNEELSPKEGISRLKLAFVLYKCLIIFCYQKCFNALKGFF